MSHPHRFAPPPLGKVEGARVTPHISRKTRVTGASVAAAALLVAGITAASTAGASPATTTAAAKGGAPLALSTSHRAELLHEAGAATAQTAKTLGLDSQEKLVVKDVIKDADG